MERGIQEGASPGGPCGGKLQGDSAKEGCRKEHQQVSPQNRVFQGLDRPVYNSEENQSEVNRGENHEDNRQDIDSHGVEGPDGEVPGAESAGCADAESMVDCIEGVHSGRPVGEEGQKTDSDVNPGKDGYGTVRPDPVGVFREGG